MGGKVVINHLKHIGWLMINALASMSEISVYLYRTETKS